MPQINRPDTSTWSYLSRKLGDFIESNLWGGDKKYFQEKYGEDWEYKYEQTRDNVRSLYGLIPQDTGGAGVETALSALAMTGIKPIRAGARVLKAGKSVAKAKKVRSIQKLRHQTETIENLSKHSLSKEGAIELKRIRTELDNYLGPQRSSRIVKQGGNKNAPSIRKLDRKKHKDFEERLDALSQREGGVVRVEYEKGLDLSKSQTAKSLTSKQRIEREKLKEEKRLFRELGGSQRGRQKGGSIL